MLKKFKYSKKVWMRYHELALKKGDGSGAADLLRRSLQSLVKPKHVPVITHFAQVSRQAGRWGENVPADLRLTSSLSSDVWWWCVDCRSRSSSTAQWTAAAPSSRASSPPTPGTCPLHHVIKACCLLPVKLRRDALSAPMPAPDPAWLAVAWGMCRRLDLWNVYVDKEVKAGHMDAARHLLDRMCTLKITAKKMKVSNSSRTRRQAAGRQHGETAEMWAGAGRGCNDGEASRAGVPCADRRGVVLLQGVLKKYLKLELEHGDEARIEAVRNKAREYVESSMVVADD